MSDLMMNYYHAICPRCGESYNANTPTGHSCPPTLEKAKSDLLTNAICFAQQFISEPSRFHEFAVWKSYKEWNRAAVAEEFRRKSQVEEEARGKTLCEVFKREEAKKKRDALLGKVLLSKRGTSKGRRR